MSKTLLVDDEPLMLKLLELYLIPYGFNCISMTFQMKRSLIGSSFLVI